MDSTTSTTDIRAGANLGTETEEVAEPHVTLAENVGGSKVPR